jgi:hypothetical protein
MLDITRTGMWPPESMRTNAKSLVRLSTNQTPSRRSNSNPRVGIDVQLFARTGGLSDTRYFSNAQGFPNFAHQSA